MGKVILTLKGCYEDELRFFGDPVTMNKPTPVFKNISSTSLNCVFQCMILSSSVSESPETLIESTEVLAQTSKCPPAISSH